MEFVVEGLPVLAELLANVGKAQAPHKRTQENICQKLMEGRFGNSGRESNKTPNYRQKLAKERGHGMVFAKKFFCQAKIAFRKQNIFSVFFHQRPSAFVANVVSNTGTN